MRKKLLLVFICLSGMFITSKAQYVTIPDTAFRSYLVANFPAAAFNASQQLDTTNTYIMNTAFGVELINSAAKNLDGLQYFRKLRYLTARLGQLETISVFPDSLTDIQIDGNYLTSLPPLPSKLTNLVALNNRLTSLPPLPNKLDQLLVDFNYLTALPALPAGLTSLFCSGNLLTALPALPDSLLYFSCEHNLLTALPALPGKLNHFACGYNHYTSLPNLLPASIESMFCDSLGLTALPPLPPNLRNFTCATNKLTSLPAMPNLQSLNCYSNLLTSLPVLSVFLNNLDCHYNHLTSLPVLPDTMNSLVCSGNFITSLPALPARLGTLECSYNLLSNIDSFPASILNLGLSNNNLYALPKLPVSITNLQVSANHLTVLPALPKSLRIVFASSNNLASLPKLPDSLTTLEVQANPSLSCLPFLPPLLGILDITGSNITCISNLPVNPNFYTDTPLPICNATNNGNQCQAYPRVYGLVYNDNNSNGIFDAGDVPREDVKVQLNNGAYGYSNNSGFFNIATDTLGSYTIDISTPPFYTPVPFSNIHSFSNYTDVVHDTFALQPTVLKDSLSVHLTPMQNSARPGFFFSYNANCQNSGTTLLSPTVTVKFDKTKITYDSSSVAGVVQYADSLRVNMGNMLQGQTNTFAVYFTVKPSAILASQLKTSATVKASAAYNTDTSTAIVRGSYDPNDKQATPEMTPTQVVSGNFIDYTIRFQNTGNDTAFTVVIADTLSNMLRTNFLQMLGTSHLCKTTLNNGIVYFEFLNINLPDSGANHTGSNGFIRFRIRPYSNVNLGDIIPNKASIYFDYNLPVVTNTCQTIIQSHLLPLSLLNYNATLQDNRKVVNRWITANEVNTSYFNIQRSSNSKDFMTVGKVDATGRGTGTQSYIYTDEPGNNAGYKLFYRLEMMDRDGKKSYSAAQMILLKHSGIAIYPNPAHSIVTVEGNGMQSVSIADMTGRILKNKSAGNQVIVTIPVADLSKGSYQVIIINQTGVVSSEKLLIE